MIHVHSNIYIGTVDDCNFRSELDESWRVIHACKDPCHKSVVGSVDSSHPNYLWLETDTDLVLNLVDARTPNFFNVAMFITSLNFIDRHKNNNILVHCNKGESRSASIAMLYLAKRLKILPDFNVHHAFKTLYHPYMPSDGIRAFIDSNWRLIR